MIQTINPKSRIEQDKTDLKVYYKKLNKIYLNIIREVLTKFPFLEGKAKTVDQRKSASRSALSEEIKEKRNEEKELVKEKHSK